MIRGFLVNLVDESAIERVCGESVWPKADCAP